MAEPAAVQRTLREKVTGTFYDGKWSPVPKPKRCLPPFSHKSLFQSQKNFPLQGGLIEIKNSNAMLPEIA